jgi:hypothetical protein
MSMKCVVCGTEFKDQLDASQRPCKSGGGHILQETLDGTRNPDTGESASFRSVDAADLKKWGEQARKIYGE